MVYMEAGPDYIFISAKLIRWTLEVGRVREDTRTAWTTCQLTCNKTYSSMHMNSIAISFLYVYQSDNIIPTIMMCDMQIQWPPSIYSV